MTAEQARDLEGRLRARGLSRKATREALTQFRVWLAEQPGGDLDPEIVDVVARALVRDLRRG